MRRSQSATEFMILFAITGIIVIILVFVLIGVPGGTTKDVQISQGLLASQAIGISDVVNRCSGVEFEVLNNENVHVQINYVQVNGTKCSTQNFTLAPTRSKSVVCYQVAECRQGASYSYEYAVNYQILDIGVAKQLNVSSLKMQGVAADSPYGLLSGALLDQLEGYWDGSGNDSHVFDIYNSNHGTLTNVTLSLNQSNGYALHYPGNGSQVRLDSTIYLYPNASTVSWWM